MADDSTTSPATPSTPPSSDAGTSTPGVNPIVDALAHVLPTAIGRARIAISPYPFGVSDDDNLRITINRQLGGSTITLTYRVLRRDGTTAAGEYDFPPAPATPNEVDIRALGGGWIVNMEVGISATTTPGELVFIKVELIRGLSGAVQAVGTILQDTIRGVNTLSWPGSPLTNALFGPPAIDYFFAAVTIPGGEVSFNPVDNVRRRIRSVTTLLTTSAAVANRFTFLQLFNPAGHVVLTVAGAASALPASQTRRFTWAAGGGQAYDNVQGNALASLPNEVILEPGGGITTTTVGLDGFDQYSQTTILSEAVMQV